MSSINVTINQINTATTISVMVLSFFSFGFGAIGLTLNILVFMRPFLRREPCAVYFFWSTCYSLLVVFVIMPIRILSDGYNIDISTYNIVICKTEVYIFHVIRTISCWLIVLASIDRYFNSSAKVQIRRMSSLKIARIATAFISSLIIILYSPMIIYYDLTYSTNGSGNIVSTCNSRKGIDRSFDVFWYLILYSLFPSLLMLLFGFLTIINLRRHRQIVPVGPGNNSVVRRTDTQLLRMLITQVFVIIIFTLPFCIVQIYGWYTASLVKDGLRLAVENLIYRVTGTIPYFAHISSFYMYTLTGTIFRKELIKIMKRCCHSNQNLMPVTQAETHNMSMLRSNL
ncbi:unnamed protein product [Adineta steineri]|uniref:G-protein coupled receptors family 1 profile domain-containing protein n=1 Tax=Adineta steineri TaxID=433720 RepID=A0A815N686_9BILA|nr:unnamed protein product [Adineta steineri]CAF1434794.1 unnamed protein product [Adineta steineri]